MTKNRDIPLQDILATIVRRRVLFASCCLLAVAIAVAVALFGTRMYRAEVVMSQVVDQGGSGVSSLARQVSALAGIDVGMNGSDGNEQAWLATLTSNAMLRRFIEKETSLQEIYWQRWDSGKGEWKSQLLGGNPAPTVGEAVQFLKREVLTVDADSRTGLITVAFKWHDPAIAARWANALVELTNDAIRQTVIEENQRNIAFLEAELEETNLLERRQIIYRLIESRTSDVMMANSRTQYAFWIIDPATPPEPNQYVWPHLPLIVAMGLIGGATLGIFVCLMAGIVPAPRKGPE